MKMPCNQLHYTPDVHPMNFPIMLPYALVNLRLEKFSSQKKIIKSYLITAMRRISIVVQDRK